MKLYVVFALRTETYPGEYAPEALEVMDEFSYEENPIYLQDKVKQARNGQEFMAADIFEIDLGRSTTAIRDRLLKPASLAGQVRPAPPQ